MPIIEFSPAEKAAMLPKIQRYFAQELDQELGDFDAEFLLDFFAEELGAYFYNRGLYDAQTLLSQQVDRIQESLDELEKPTESSN